MDKNFEYMQENITERTLYMWVFIPRVLPAERAAAILF